MRPVLVYTDETGQHVDKVAEIEAARAHRFSKDLPGPFGIQAVPVPHR
jgi:hypothetical protein